MKGLFILTLCFWGLLSCNPLKQLEKQQQAIESLVNKVNASKVVTYKDSTILVKGELQTVKDTIVIIDTTGGKQVEKYYFNTYYNTKDTLKIQTRDYTREQSLFQENEKNKALYLATESNLQQVRKIYSNVIFILCGLVAVLFIVCFFLSKIKI